MFSLLCQGQTNNTPLVFRITSAHTAFPDSARSAGHIYDKVLYDAATHYNDSSVMIVVPPGFKPGKKIDIVVWFHGWRNNIDSAAGYFELISQFMAANRNAILVLPETTKNAPDSYGGKLELPVVFKYLLNDVLNKLRTENIISKKSRPGNITLAGHSGAFRVMAYILQKSTVEVKQVFLFDGLYSQIDKYINWIQADTTHHFINLYTNKGGGTDEVSIDMMKQLDQKNISYLSSEEKDITGDMVLHNRLIFIHSLKEHNDVMNRPDHNFRLFLQNSPALQPILKAP